MFTVNTLGSNEPLLKTPDFLTACELMQSRQSLPKMDDRAHIEVQMDYASAVGFLKALRGYDWFWRAETWAPTLTDSARGFTLHGSIRTTRKEALRVLDSMYGDRFKKECQVRFTIHPQAVFVG